MVAETAQRKLYRAFEYLYSYGHRYGVAGRTLTDEQWEEYCDRFEDDKEQAIDLILELRREVMASIPKKSRAKPWHRRIISRLQGITLTAEQAEEIILAVRSRVRPI